jgi:hypothetical protein
MNLHDDMREAEQRLEQAWPRALLLTVGWIAFAFCCLVVAGAFR